MSLLFVRMRESDLVTHLVTHLVTRVINVSEIVTHGMQGQKQKEGKVRRH